MKKILIDLERLRYPNSGIANVFRNLAKAISFHLIFIKKIKNPSKFLHSMI